MTNPFDLLQEQLNRIENKLGEFDTFIHRGISNNLPETDHPITIQQVSEQTKLSVATLYGYVSRNEIPFSKRPNSKRLWFSKQEITNWLLDGRKKTISEISNQANTYVKIKNGKL